MFESIGLTAEQEEAYFMLLRHPSLTVDEFAASRSSWSRSKASRVLKVLVDKGLVTAYAGQPRRFAPIPPDMSVEGWARRLTDQARDMRQSIGSLMEDFWQARDNPQVREFVEVLPDDNPESVRRRVRQLYDAARVAVRAFDRPPYMQPTYVLNRGEIESLSRGVRHQVIYDQVEVDNPARWPDLEAGIAEGEEARVHRSLPVKLILFDDWGGTISLVTPSGRYGGTVVIHQSQLLEALSALFVAYWERAVPISLGESAAADRASGGLSERNQRIGSLLAAGLSDSAIQRQLGLSASTVQRSIRELMDTLGVKTRFQAGVQIGRTMAAKD